MQSAISLTIELAPASPTDAPLQALRGARVRALQLTQDYTHATAVQDDAWQGTALLREKTLQLELEGVLGTDAAQASLRKAALQGSTLRARLTWPGMAQGEGVLVVTGYREFAEGLEALRYEAQLESSGGLTLTFGA